MRPLPSAEVALYRREGWREGERKRAGDDGKVKEAKQRLPPFPSSYRPPRAFYFRLLTLLLGYPAGASTEERVMRPTEPETLLELIQPNKK